MNVFFFLTVGEQVRDAGDGLLAGTEHGAWLGRAMSESWPVAVAKCQACLQNAGR